jgi:hypothetical protein
MQYYSEDKKENLKYGPNYCNDMLTDEVFKGWIEENIKLTLETGVFRLPGNNNSDASKELTKLFLSENIIDVAITDKNRLFSLLNRNKSNEADISALLPLMNSCDITSAMVFTFIESLDLTLVLESIKAESFDIDKNYENLNNMIKDNLSNDLNNCMEAFKVKELTPEKRIPTNQDVTRFTLNDLHEGPVKAAAIEYYESLKGATLPENVRQKVQDNALQLTLKTIRDEIGKKMRNDDMVKQMIRDSMEDCFTVDAEGYVDVSTESLNKLSDKFSLVKDAARKCHNSATTSIKIPALNIENEAIASMLSVLRFTDEFQNEKENILKSYRDELLVSGLLTPEIADDLKVIIQRNIENGHGKFLNSLLHNLRASRSDLFRQHGVERVILSPGHLFDLSTKRGNEFFPQFLATLNLCNRSSRRHLRNLRDDNLQRKTDEVHPRGWKFPQSSKWSVFDNHKFTIKGKRKDETLELGGYKVVYEIIEKIKFNLNKYIDRKVTDKDIAFWIRSIINGKLIVQDGALVRSDKSVLAINQFKKLPDKMVAQLIKITYLLFGSEVMRNPASLIHHQMMIDLILDGMMTWKEALNGDDGGEMPMSMKNAVASARILHKRFLPYMPHPYYYDPLEVVAAAKEDVLLHRENVIYDNWFIAFLEEEDTDKVRLKVLSEAVEQWYGLIIVNNSLVQSESTELEDVTNSLKNFHMVRSKKMFWYCVYYSLLMTEDTQKK